LLRGAGLGAPAKIAMPVYAAGTHPAPARRAAPDVRAP
jgi:hypothetical protein